MDVVFENISSLIAFSILFLVVYAALLNVYFIHKNGFQVRVNCWFCNKNSKVLYGKRNSFECPYCSQYNGFNKNGDYNRVIEAQHNEYLNNSNLSHNENTVHSIPQSSNGLCDSCNRNQQLRVLQLAKYEPLNQKNYEKEIEHFEKQLEKTYKLCKNCSKVLKSTIRKQNAWIFGNKLKNLKSPTKKGLFTFKRNKQSQGSIEDSKSYFKFSIVRFILLMISFLNLFFLCGFNSFIPNYLLPEVSLPNNVIFSTIYSKIHNVTVKKLGQLSFLRQLLPNTLNIQGSSTLRISILGFIVEFVFTLMESNCTFFGKLSKLLSWIILGLISTVHFKSDISVYISTLQIFCSFWLVYSYSSSFLYFQGNHQPKKFTLKRLRKTNENNDCSDNEENSYESLNNSGETYRTALNKHSPITASSLNNSPNRSFESARSTKTIPLLNSTFTHNELTARNLELNKHFNDLNLGAFEANRPMSCRSYQMPSTTNPFLNYYNRTQSANSMFNYGMGHTSPGSVFSMQPSQNNLFKLQNPTTNSSFVNAGNSLFMDNQAQKLFPRSNRSERMSVQSQPYTLASNTYNPGLSSPNHESTAFVLQNNSGYDNTLPPKNTDTVLSQNISMSQRSPTYSLRSQSGQNASFLQNSQQTQLNNMFRPLLSPGSTIERPSRNLLSPSKFNNIKSFYSTGKENENLSLSFHTGNEPTPTPTSDFWSNMGSPHLHQRFVVNSVPELQRTSALSGSFIASNVEKHPLGNSRSSSSSSGFISNGDFNKVYTRSLPNSRDNSPDRNSLLSEPAYHFKMD